MSKPFTLNQVKPDDVVRCDVKGRRFFAVVVDHAEGVDHTPGLDVRPITRESFRHVSAVQVIELYRKARPRPPRSSARKGPRRAAAPKS